MLSWLSQKYLQGLLVVVEKKEVKSIYIHSYDTQLMDTRGQ